MEHSLTGWDIADADDVDWAPWGARGDARAKLLASADGFNLVVVVADPGYAAERHVHGFPELVYVLDGTLRVQGHELRRGDGYAAAAGSVHTELRTDSGARYLVVYKL
jgi:quercetin dioxygenase-like cupin family protein